MSFTPHNIGAMEVRGNTTQTSVPSSGEFIAVDGNIWEEVKTSNMEFSGNSLLVENYGDYMISLSLSATVESADVEFEFIIAANGDVISHSRLKTTFATTESQQVGLSALEQLEKGDELTLKVKNNTNSTNITVEDAFLRAVRV